jgi:hypothetical protein
MNIIIFNLIGRIKVTMKILPLFVMLFGAENPVPDWLFAIVLCFYIMIILSFLCGFISEKYCDKRKNPTTKIKKE